MLSPHRIEYEKYERKKYESGRTGHTNWTFQTSFVCCVFLFISPFSRSAVICQFFRSFFSLFSPFDIGSSVADLWNWCGIRHAMLKIWYMFVVRWYCLRERLNCLDQMAINTDSATEMINERAECEWTADGKNSKISNCIVCLFANEDHQIMKCYVSVTPAVRQFVTQNRLSNENHSWMESFRECRWPVP